MASRIYVENLPNDITEDGLKDVFSQIGAVESVKLEAGLFTHRSKGSGYIDMLLDVDAFRVVNCFDGALFKDRQIHLKEAKPFHQWAKDVLRRRADILAHKAEEMKRQYTNKIH